MAGPFVVSSHERRPVSSISRVDIVVQLRPRYVCGNRGRREVRRKRQIANVSIALNIEAAAAISVWPVSQVGGVGNGSG